MKPIELTRIRNNGYQFEETITFQKEIYENPVSFLMILYEKTVCKRITRLHTVSLLPHLYFFFMYTAFKNLAHHVVKNPCNRPDNP